MTALARLFERYGIAPSDVGRLEVGTETLLDKSKSVKTALLALFGDDCADLEGVTSTNACYGGTAALLNSAAWVESSAWDGRYAVVVCGDIAVYAPGPARPTGGGGAVAMLIGPDAPLALAGPRATHAFEVYDFYKPRGDTEYATVDGKLSQAAFLTCVDRTWAGLKRKLHAAAGGGGAPPTLDAFKYVCMHSPYQKLVQKGFARLLYGDFVDAPAAPEFAGDAQRWAGVPAAETVNDRDAEKCFVGLAKERFASKCAPSDTVSKACGNSYTAAVYMNLLSLVCAKGGALGGERVLMFSYGSGCVATAFLLEAREPAANALGGRNAPFTLGRIATTAAVAERLGARAPRDVAAMNAALALREAAHGRAEYEPRGDVGQLLPGTFYLKAVDALYRREYGRVPHA
jgi:hydroxymethylglutaryl-CoA synthase